MRISDWKSDVCSADLSRSALASRLRHRVFRRRSSGFTSRPTARSTPRRTAAATGLKLRLLMISAAPKRAFPLLSKGRSFAQKLEFFGVENANRDQKDRKSVV